MRGGKEKSKPIVGDKFSQKFVENPNLLIGLQAGVGGALWRGSSSGSGVGEVAISKGGRELALGESFVCISDPGQSSPGN